jgi:hypothetical protein
MIRSDILRMMAWESDPFKKDGKLYALAKLTPETLERFAALVAAAEADRIANESKHIIKRAEERGAAAEREWVGLTDEDLNFWAEELGQGELGKGVLRAVDEYLKEKNK